METIDVCRVVQVPGILLNLEEQLERLLEAADKGERVRVQLALAWSEPTANKRKDEYPSCIAVHGNLEASFYRDGAGHDRVMFRVLSTEKGDQGTCYAYFGPEDFWVVADRTKTEKGVFDGGATLAIYLQGEPTHPYVNKVITDMPLSDTVGGGKT